MSSNYLHGFHIPANGIRQHLLRYGGKGPKLLVVPGITSPAVTWGFVAETLAQHFDVHVLDVRGRGLSSAGPELDYSLDALANDLTAVLSALDWQDATVLGHSMGARIAVRAAARMPSRFGRLLLIDPPVGGPGRRPYPTPLAWYIDSIRLMAAGGPWEELKRFSPSWTEAQLRLRAQWLHTCDETAIEEAWKGFHSDDIHADFASLAVPGLLMMAGRGGVIQNDDAAEIARLTPGLQQVVAIDAGHMIPWDDEAGFFRLLGAYLKLSFQPEGA
jgi:N-formylmaleamate deformylase